MQPALLRPGPPRRPLLFWSALLLALAALVGGAVVAVRGYADTRGPAGAVRGYVDALRRGDAAAALGFGNLPTGNRVLLSLAVLREQQRVAPIVDVDIGTARRSGTAAQVPVSYSLRYPSGVDRRVDAVIPVHETGGEWRLDAVAVRTRIAVGSAGQRASVLGRLVPTGDVLAFPGAPPIRLDTAYLELDPDVGIVPGPADDPADTAARTFAVGVTDVGRVAMQRAVLTGLRTCLAAARPAPTCPLPSARYVPGSVHGTVSDLPSDVSVTLTETEVGTLELSGSVPVAATAYRRLDFENRVIAGRGPVTVAVHAVAAAHAPLTISWLAP